MHYLYPLISPNPPLSQQCSGTSSGPVNLSWTESAGAQYYNVLRKLSSDPNVAASWQSISGNLPAEVLGNPITVFTDFNPSTGTSYDYVIYATNPSGGATLSDSGTVKTIITPSCQPPTITSLNIIQGPPPVTNNFSGGATNTSGRQATEQGSNWFNSIEIKVDATPGSGSIRNFKVDFSPGFSIAYSPTSEGDCSSGNYCVLDGGTWQAIDRIIGRRYVSAGCNPDPLNSTCLISVEPAGTDDSSYAKWRVYFYKSFGDKTMTTSATVTNTYGLTTSRTF